MLSVSQREHIAIDLQTRAHFLFSLKINHKNSKYKSIEILNKIKTVI